MTPIKGEVVNIVQEATILDISHKTKITLLIPPYSIDTVVYVVVKNVFF